MNALLLVLVKRSHYIKADSVNVNMYTDLVENVGTNSSCSELNGSENAKSSTRNESHLYLPQQVSVVGYTGVVAEHAGWSIAADSEPYWVMISPNIRASADNVLSVGLMIGNKYPAT
ncbi:hypothetical protein MAR_009385, partial [Mya arenaria]